MKKDWYKHGWGLLAAILLFPLFVIWYAWAKSNWSKNAKIAVSLALLVFMGVALVVGGKSGPSKQTGEPNGTPKQLTSYIISDFVDGDTLKVKVNNDPEQAVRLIGIDTPETKDPRTTVQCFGAEASQHLQDLLKDKKISLEADASQDNKDKYDRLLRYIKLEDGTDINLKMIADGYAYEYTYDKPYNNQAAYKKAQIDADAQDKGLWSPDTCNGQRTKPTPTATPTPTPTPTPEPTPAPSNCDPNYTPCVPNVSYDLDCGDISFSVRVIGTDRHRFDRDGDGYGCESN